jgi:predicted nucleic acid-binding protein
VAEGDYKGAIEHAAGAIPGGKIAAKLIKAADKIHDVAAVGVAIASVKRISSASKGGVALDSNAVIAAIKEGKKTAVEQAISGRTPLVSRTVIREARVKNTKEEVRTFMQSTGAKVAKAGTEAEARNLQGLANSMGRKLQTNDARIAASAKREGVSVITNDKKFNRFLNAAGIGGETY